MMSMKFMKANRNTNNFRPMYMPVKVIPPKAKEKPYYRSTCKRSIYKGKMGRTYLVFITYAFNQNKGSRVCYYSKRVARYDLRDMY